MKKYDLFLLTADFGTSSVKTAIIRQDGVPFAYARTPYSSVDNGGLFLAQDWISAFKLNLHQLLKDFALQCPGDRVSGIGISGNAPSIVPVDVNRNCCGPSLLWKGPSDRVKGQPSYFLSGINWYRKNLPEIYEKTLYFTGCPEWICQQLCETAFLTLPCVELSPYFYTPEQFAIYSLPADILPPLLSPFDIVGHVTGSASKIFGLPVGIPVVCVGPDYVAALAGSGSLKYGVVCDRAGSSEGLNLCSKQFLYGNDFLCIPHPCVSGFNVSSVIKRSGSLFEWLCTSVGMEHMNYDQIVSLAIDGISESGYVPAFLPDAVLDRGQFAGPCGSGDVPSRILSFLIYLSGTFKNTLDNMERNSLKVDSIVLCGGQSRSDIWSQMKADVSGRVLQVPVLRDCELTGCAAYLLTSMRETSNLVESVSCILKIEKVIEPNYKKYQLYQKVIDKIGKPLNS